MTQQTRGPRVHERWAHLRFSVIGQLLAAPPAKGELKAAIEGLAGRTWQHPTTGEPVRFGFSTITEDEIPSIRVCFAFEVCIPLGIWHLKVHRQKWDRRQSFHQRRMLRIDAKVCLLQ